MFKLKKGNTLVLVLDEENVQRMKKNQPVMVKGKDVQIPYDIFIAYSDQSLADFLEEICSSSTSLMN